MPSVAVDAGVLDRLADAQLVAVRGCGVDVPVADLEGVADDPIGLLGVDLEDSEAQGAFGDLQAVVEAWICEVSTAPSTVWSVSLSACWVQ